MKRRSFIKGSSVGMLSLLLGNLTTVNRYAEATGYRYRITDDCSGCQRCYAVCPSHAIDITTSPTSIRQESCWRCGKCYEICPAEAIVREADS